MPAEDWLAEVLHVVKGLADGEHKTHQLTSEHARAALAAVPGIVLSGAGIKPPEPAEPPPGVYRDTLSGRIWTRRQYASGEAREWTRHGRVGQLCTWPEVPNYLDGELERLWSAAELIPDPDDPNAVHDVLQHVHTDKGIEATIYGVAQSVLRVLRARAESRTREA